MRAVIYLRASKDHNDDEATIRRHERACHKLVETREWELVADPFVDNDTSAYSGVARPGFSDLCALVARGGCDVVVAQHPDRLWRQPLDREGFLIIAKEAGLTIISTVQGGDERIGDADSQMMGDLQVIFARRESATIGRRLRAKHADKRDRGEWPGGPAPFGYQLDSASSTLTVDPETAPIVQEAARRMMAGETGWAIVADFKARGVPTANGGTWTVSGLRRRVLSPAATGLRSAGETYIEGNWPAIIDRDVWEVLTVESKGRSKGKRGPNRRYALSGIARTEDGDPVVCTRTGRGVPIYRGPGVQMGVDLAEDAVRDRIAEYLDSDAFAERMRLADSDDTETAALVEAIAVDRERLAGLTDLLVDGLLDRDDFRRQQARLSERIASAEVALVKRRESYGLGSFAGMTGEAFRQAWPSMAPHERRAIVADLTGSLVIRPRQKGGARRQSDRIVWSPRW